MIEPRQPVVEDVQHHHDQQQQRHVQSYASRFPVVESEAQRAIKVQRRHHHNRQHRHAHQPAVQELQRRKLEYVEADVLAELRVLDAKGLRLEIAQHDVPLPRRDRPEYHREEDRPGDHRELIHASHGGLFLFRRVTQRRRQDRTQSQVRVHPEVDEENQRPTRE
jgi:hypothetical protein